MLLDTCSLLITITSSGSFQHLFWILITFMCRRVNQLLGQFVPEAIVYKACFDWQFRVKTGHIRIKCSLEVRAFLDHQYRKSVCPLSGSNRSQ
jgi:hypothetical protein